MFNCEKVSEISIKYSSKHWKKWILEEYYKEEYERTILLKSIPRVSWEHRISWWFHTNQTLLQYTHNEERYCPIVEDISDPDFEDPNNTH